MSNEKPEILLLDVMSTLVVDPFPDTFLEFFDMTMDEFMDKKDVSAWPDFECNRISEDQFFDRFFNGDERIRGKELKKTLKNTYRWIDGVENLLQNLNLPHDRVHAFSNYSTWYRMIDNKLGLSRYLRWTFVSCKTGVRKPDAEAYEIVEDRLGVSPAKVLFVDNKSENIETARERNFMTHQFTGAEALESEFEERNLLP